LASQPVNDSSELSQGEKVLSKFVPACGHAGPTLKTTKEVFDAVSDAIVSLIVRRLDFAIASGWKAGFVSHVVKGLTQIVIVKTSISHDEQTATLIQEFYDMVPLVGLAWNRNDLNQSPLDISQRHQFGIAPTFGFAHGLGIRATYRIGSALVDPDMSSIN
jgi:hypothetical protein